MLERLKNNIGRVLSWLRETAWIVCIVAPCIVGYVVILGPYVLPDRVKTGIMKGVVSEYVQYFAEEN